MMIILTTIMMRFDPPPTCPTVQCLRSPQGFRKLLPPGTGRSYDDADNNHFVQQHEKYDLQL